MKRRVLSLVLLLPILLAMASGAASDLPPVMPEATVEMAAVGEPGPRLVAGERTYTTVEFIAIVVQDANLAWARLFEVWERSFVPPTVVTVGEGGYARSSCGINVGDPRDDENLTPILFCQYGGEVGTQLLDSSVIAETTAIFTPVVYLSVPWLEAYAEESGTDADVALAYRVTREYSHHVQYLLGYIDHTGGGCCDTSDEHVALLAECYTGVWANSAYDRGHLDLASVSSAQDAAWGDDATPLRMFGRTAEFGDAQQRMDAFTAGYESGSPATCLD